MSFLLILLSLLFVSCGGGGSETPQTIAVPQDNQDPPPPEIVTLNFAGTFSCGSDAHGTFTYLNGNTYAGANVRGLEPNFTYVLTEWLFTGNSRCDGLPSSTFKNGEPGQLAEFCVGRCQFSDDLVIMLTLTNQTDNVVMQLVWALPENVPSHKAPESLASYGLFQQSLYRVPCPICSPVGLFKIGVLMEPAPPALAPSSLPSL